MRGDRVAVDALRSLADSLERGGHTILTRHLLEDNVEGAESRLGEREVYERDIRWLESSDLLIADASGSSFGVGFEVGYVLGRCDRTSQRVILLYRGDRRDRISRLICGNSHPHCSVMAYDSPEQLTDQVLAHLKPKA